jgi:hypothetical protein
MHKKSEKERFFLTQWIGILFVKAGFPLEGFKILEDDIAKHPLVKNRASMVEIFSCLDTVKKKFPSLELDPKALDTALSLAPVYPKPGDAADLKDLLYLVGLDSINNGSFDTVLSKVIDALKSDSLHHDVLQSLQASAMGKTEEALPLLQPLEPALTKLGASQLNSLSLLLGQLQFTSGKFEDSLKTWTKVSADSNNYAESLLGTSWANLNLEKYSDAVGVAYNLLVGPLQHTFQPESYLIMAISMNEVCDYPRAAETLRAYKKAYGKSYSWLAAWEKEKTGPYSLVTKFLKDDPTIPGRIGLEWAQNPFFLSRQDEINQILLERGKMSDAKIKNLKGNSLRTYLATRREENSNHENEIVKSIDSVLTKQTEQMRSSLDGVSEQMQLVQAEILSSVGEKMILDNAGIKAPATGAAQDKSGASSGSVWDWGNYSTDTEEGGEFWTDELGFLKAEVKDLCAK